MDSHSLANLLGWYKGIETKGLKRPNGSNKLAVNLKIDLLALGIKLMSQLDRTSEFKGKVQTLDWTTGMDYWTDIFLVFTHFVVG